MSYWRENETAVTVSFSVNPSSSSFLLATIKTKDRNKEQFVVDAISSDGGGIPRNVAVKSGMNLVNFGALTMKEFVRKTSRRPAEILGLWEKGHISIGADADITVIDPKTSSPVATIVEGQVIMYKGHVFPNKTKVITTTKGKKAVEERGLEPHTIDLENSFYK